MSTLSLKIKWWRGRIVMWLWIILSQMSRIIISGSFIILAIVPFPIGIRVQTWRQRILSSRLVSWDALVWIQIMMRWLCFWVISLTTDQPNIWDMNSWANHTTSLLHPMYKRENKWIILTEMNTFLHVDVSVIQAIVVENLRKLFLYLIQDLVYYM